MSARRDASRVAALVVVLETVANREPVRIGDAAEAVFGWTTDRVFAAIAAAIETGLIKPEPGGPRR